MSRTDVVLRFLLATLWYLILQCPMVFLLVITTPVVDYDEDLHKWNRYLNSLQLTTGLVFSSLATKGSLYFLFCQKLYSYSLIISCEFLISVLFLSLDWFIKYFLPTVHWYPWFLNVIRIRSSLTVTQENGQSVPDFGAFRMGDFYFWSVSLLATLTW